jgi:hypothetical protein
MAARPTQAPYYPSLDGKADPQVRAALQYAFSLIHEKTGATSQIQTVTVQTAAGPQVSAVFVLPVVTTLPIVTDTLAYEGSIVFLSTNRVLYRFDTSSPPGSWVAVLGVLQVAKTLTGNITELAPSDVPDGSEVEYRYTQDGVGAWVVNWAADFHGVDALTVGRTANRLSFVRFRRVGAVYYRLFSLGDIA